MTPISTATGAVKSTPARRRCACRPPRRRRLDARERTRAAPGAAGRGRDAWALLIDGAPLVGGQRLPRRLEAVQRRLGRDVSAERVVELLLAGRDDVRLHDVV